MLVVDIAIDLVEGPKCERCGAFSRIFGIETHAVIKTVAIRTFECTRCGNIGTALAMLPLGKPGCDHAR